MLHEVRKENHSCVDRNMVMTASLRGLRLVLLLAVFGSLLATIGVTSDQRTAESAAALPIYDTAWDMPFWANQSEAATYLDHIQNAGYTGLWLSLFNHTGGGMYATSPGSGHQTASLQDGQFNLNDGHAAHVRKILDMANDRGLKVGLVPIWGVFYLNDLSRGCDGGSGAGPLKSWNAYWLGQQIARKFADHPAIDTWVLGGDNFCAWEDVNIWRNMAAGLENDGAWQKMTYHTAGTQDRHLQFANEGWVDFLSPQTGHCINATGAERDLKRVVASTNKPVWAAEMRYEAVEPDWPVCPEHGPGNPPSADEITADVQAARNAGVSAIMFGNNERWQWASGGALGSRGGGTAKVFSTFWSPGEKAFLAATGAGSTPSTTSTPPSTTPPSSVAPSTTTTPPTTSAPAPSGEATTVVIYAAGQTGTERLQLQIGDRQIADFDVKIKVSSNQTQRFEYIYAGTVNPGQVRLNFLNDFRNADGSFDRNLKIPGIELNGKYYATTNPAVYSVGGYTLDSGCNPGNKQTDHLACSGYFQFADVAPDNTNSTTPTTTTPTSPATTVVEPGIDTEADSIVHIYAAGNNGDEIMDLRVDGTTVGTWTVGGNANAAQYQEFTYRHTGKLSSSQVRVRFLNDLWAPPVDRNLRVDRIVIDGVTYQTEDPGVRSKGSWNPTNSCNTGEKQSETLHCNGWFQYN